MDLNTQQEVHLSHYWNVMRKRWKIAAAILFVVMLGTFLASYFSKPLYRAGIRIEIERETANPTIEDLFGIAGSDQEFLMTQYELLQSRGLGLRVIEEHKLLNDPEFYPPGVAGKTPAEVRDIAQGMAGAILGGVSVSPVRNTRLIDIYYVASSPRLAQKIAEAWGESFMRMNIEKKMNSVRQASEFLSEQISQVEADLEQSRHQLQTFGESKGILTTSEGSTNTAVDKLSQISLTVTTAQNELYAKEAAYNSIRSMGAETAAANDPLVLRLTDDLTRMQREYDEKKSQYLEQHPVMTRLADQIAKARTSRANAVANAHAKAVEAARAEWTAAQQREAAARGDYERQRGEAQKQSVGAARYVDLQMAVQTKQSLLGALQKQLSETSVAARIRSASTNVHWVDHATSPGSRINLSTKKNLQTAFPLGLILGLAAIFFLEYMDRSIKTPEELERVTGFASLGVIPAAGSISRTYGSTHAYGRTPPRLRAVESQDDKQAGIDLIPHTDARSPVAEAYRAFRTSLLLASASSPKVMVITSSFAREGKTTTSVNLATVLAQMGKPVLLIDADLRRPRLQKVFTGKMNLGLVNYLAANIPIEDTIQNTDVPNLQVMLAGPIPPNPSELLASDRMKHLIEELRAKYAYVIFDSPPVLAVTDAVVLSANADGVVLCVHGGQTPRELVQRSAERLRLSNIPVLGAILNNLDLHQYGYTYRKSYYDYYESNDEQSQPSRKSM